jgi:hypothetical protein
MRLLFFCLFACFLFNCGHPTVPRNIDVTRISKSDLQKVRSFDPTQLIDSCTYIPLETSDRILIGRVKQLKITDKYIFLVNSENDSLYVFNRQGKFLNTIGTRGRGPREYRSIQSYCFPPQADTVIISIRISSYFIRPETDSSGVSIWYPNYIGIPISSVV